MTYKSENEILDVIAKFERCEIERGSWGHPEHLILAYHYSLNYDFETAISKMREGIFNLLDSFGVDRSIEDPYHETLTVFWMNTIYDFAKDKKGYSVDTINGMIERFDKHYPGRFYSHDLLFSEKARREFVEGDIP